MKQLFPKRNKTEKKRSECRKIKKTLRSKSCIKLLNDDINQKKEDHKNLKEVRKFYQSYKNKISKEVIKGINYFFYDVYNIEYIFNKFYVNYKDTRGNHKALFKEHHIKEIQKLYGKTNDVKQHIKNAILYLVYLKKNNKQMDFNLKLF